MAYKEEIIIDVVENGLDEANQKLKTLKGNSDEATAGQKNLGSSVLENGGAMGLLNDATGGLAMTIKDAVEATVLFTKGSTIATTAQKMYTAVVGASTGGMKLFRIALASTGIGAIVVGLGLLIANFDKVKKAVLNLVPALAIVGDVISGLVEAVTDFIGVTSDASRALDDMVSKSEASLKRNEHFLEANGDKYDQYTQKKLQANIDFNKKVLELNENEELSESEKLQRISEFREKANREILKADADRNAETKKKNKELADKQADIAKQQAEKQKAINDKAIEAERSRLEAIQAIQKDYNDKLLDLDATTDQQKRDLEEKRKLAELTNLKATEEQKKSVRDYYDRLEKKANEIANAERDELIRNRTEAQRQAVLDQQQWEIDNGEDGLVKLEKQRELLEMQAEFDIEKLQYIIDTAEAESQAKIDAETSFNARLLQKKNELATNEKEIEKEKARVVLETETAKRNILQGTLDFSQQGVELFKTLAGENKALQKAALVANSALSIAQIIANTNVGATQEVATKGIFGLSTSAVLYTKMALSIGSVIAATAKGLQGIGASGGGGGGSTSTNTGGNSAPTTPPPPSFNLVQGTGANQIASAIAGQNAPIQAYVVSGNVTNAQALDRNIIQNSRL